MSYWIKIPLEVIWVATWLSGSFAIILDTDRPSLPFDCKRIPTYLRWMLILLSWVLASSLALAFWHPGIFREYFVGSPGFIFAFCLPVFSYQLYDHFSTAKNPGIVKDDIRLTEAQNRLKRHLVICISIVSLVPTYVLAGLVVWM
jgi:hypothetical protein